MCLKLLLTWLMPVISNVACIYTYIPHVPIKYIVYMCSLVGIFVSSIYMVLTFSNIISAWPNRMRAVWAILTTWQPDLFSDIRQLHETYFQSMCTVLLITWLMAVTCLAYRCTCTPLYMPLKGMSYIYVYGISVKFGGHACFWYIYGGNM